MKSQLLLVFALLIASTGAHLYIRVAHAAVKAPAVDIAANGTIIVSNLSYPTVTDYLKVNAGDYSLEVLVHGTNTTVFKVSKALDNSKSYTFIATGDPAVNESFTVVAIEDDKTNPADSYTSRVRAFHGVADIPEAQILVNGNIVAELNYKQTTPYLVLAQGTYHVALHRKVGNFSGEVYSTQLNVVGGTVYTVFAEGLYNNSGVNDIAFAVKADAVYNYLVGRAAHASPNSPNVDVYVHDLVDGGMNKVAADLKFNGFSAYTLIAFEPTKNYSVVLTLVNDPNTVLFTAEPIFQPMVVTAAILGLHSNATTTPLHIQFFTDVNTAPADPTTASIKFIHAIPGALPASLVSGTQVLFPQIPYDTTSDYMVVPAGQTTFHVVVNGSTILTKEFNLVAGSVYSFYAEGEVATASLQIVSDASYTYTTVRVSHAAPEAPNVDVVFKDVQGNTVSTFSDVAYGKTTGYTLFVVQDMTVNLVAAGKTIFTDSVTFTKDVLNTLVVFGTPNTNFTQGLATKVFQDDNTYPATSQLSSVRFVHAIVGGPHVNINLNGVALFTNVDYQEATAYKHDVAEGTYTVTVSSDNITIISFSQYFVGGAVYTIFAEGEVGVHSKVPAHQVVNLDEAYNYTTIRVAHASYDSPAVDIIFTDGVNTIVFAKNVVFGFISDYQEIVLFNYNLKVAPTGTNDFKLNQPIKLTRDSISTVAVIGLLKSNTTTSLEGVVYPDDRTDPSNSDISRGRFVHAVADGAPNVDVYFNDQIQFQNIAYGTATPYKDLEVQTYRVDIYAAGTHTKPLSSKTWTLTGGQVFSLFAEGVPTNIEQKSFNDFAVTFYRVRVAHASPDAGEVQVLVEGEAVWSNVAFQQITTFQEFTSDKKNISIVSGGHIVLQTNTGFPANEDTTLLIVGLTKGNTTTPLELITVSDKTTVPSSTTVSSVRVAFTTPDAPPVDLLFNGTAQFTQLTYKTTTPYKEIPAGDYVLEVNTTLGHIKTNVLLKGGVTYTLFFEGLFPNAVVLPEVDYFPPTDARVRFLHASPDTGAVDLLVNGSADIRDVTFSKISDYVSTNAGESSFGIVATGTLLPNLYTTSKHLEQSMDYSFIFVGLSNKNATTALEAIIAADDNTLPAEGQLKIRFVHASPNAPHIDIRANSVPLFSNVSYQEVTKYVTTEAAFYDLDILLAGKTDVVFSSRLDLRVASGSAVYTLVAEGLVQQEPALTIVAYLDNGAAPPGVQSSSRHHGLSGVAIGLIIGGVAVGVIILAAAGFVFYKKRKERVGYSEIPSKE